MNFAIWFNLLRFSLFFASFFQMLRISSTIWYLFLLFQFLSSFHVISTHQKICSEKMLRKNASKKMPFQRKKSLKKCVDFELIPKWLTVHRERRAKIVKTKCVDKFRRNFDGKDQCDWRTRCSLKCMMRHYGFRCKEKKTTDWVTKRRVPIFCVTIGQEFRVCAK